jgi:sarcosine oxidase subunit gamma
MTYDEVQPEHCQHRSFVYRKFSDLSVSWSEINGYAAALSIHDPKSEIKYAQKMALCDLSYLQRIGFKGKCTNEWLLKQGITIPENINNAVVLSDGALVAKLGQNDILILDHLENNTDIKRKLEQQWHSDYADDNHGCGYMMPRQDSHSCICISGIHAPEMFSTLCAVDLRTHKFNNLAIAQTSVARISTIIIRRDLGETPAYYVLVENVSLDYLWECINDAMQESSGELVGLSCLLDLMA